MRLGMFVWFYGFYVRARKCTCIYTVSILQPSDMLPEYDACSFIHDRNCSDLDQCAMNSLDHSNTIRKSRQYINQTPSTVLGRFSATPEAPPSHLMQLFILSVIWLVQRARAQNVCEVQRFVQVTFVLLNSSAWLSVCQQLPRFRE